MINSKQRAYLRGLANREPALYAPVGVGCGGRENAYGISPAY